MKELSEEELLDWLETNLNRSCMLQASHPHLAWYPTKKDKQIWQKTRKAIEFCFKYGDGKFKATWDKANLNLEEATSLIEKFDNMPGISGIPIYNFIKWLYKNGYKISKFEK